MVRPSVITKYMLPDFAGRVIDGGRLQLLDSLGSGAYGRVHIAVDTTSSEAKKRYYAVKCLWKPTPGSRQDEFQKREFEIHRLVHHHPNIVTLHNIVYDHLFAYVVLDLCAGGDLFTAIVERKVFERNDLLVKWTFLQLIDAVHYCHQRGIFHRDIKPENILISEDGARIFLADFGLSTWDDVSVEFGCGSSYYMSPECIGKDSGSHYAFSTRQSDIWSLGVILTNMISGHNPWRYATFDDEGFATFLSDDSFLCRVLPISEGANNILKKIFIVNPFHRISLPKLREDILALDTFFSTKEQCQVVDIPAHHQTNSNAQTDGVWTRSNSSLSSDEYYKFRSPEVEGTSASAILVTVNNVNPAGPSNCLTRAKETDSVSTRSGQESEGPITPATKAVDPKIHIPDIEDEMKGLSLNSHVSSASDILSKIKKPFAKSTQLLRLGMTRFAGLSRKEAC